MSGNQLKLIACITMVIDHIGYLLFPDMLIFRYVGRISMPIFADFIAEGCRYTHSRIKYFAKLFSLAIICQIAYLIEDLTDGSLSAMHLNILFTFSLAVLVCGAYLNLSESAEKISKQRLFINMFLFSAALWFSLSCCAELGSLFPVSVYFDYGIAGVLLPLFAVIFPDKERRLPLFSVGMIIFNLLLCKQMPYIWFSLLAIPLLLFYSGLRGKRRLKTFFYLFYPLHFATIYMVDLIAF